MNNKMDLDFLEIGTSDFETLIEKATDETVGISIEPIPEYLNRLVDKKNCIKLNCCVSNYDGTIKLFYIPSDIIKEHGLPFWIRGCNSVNSSHPSVVKYLEANELPDLIQSIEVPVMTLSSLVNKYDISTIKLLKVDTEGHDTVILSNYLNCCQENPKLLAKMVLFESNSLSDSDEVEKIIDRFVGLGYRVRFRNIDTLLVKDMFTPELPGTYLSAYLDGYDPLSLPHDNTLEAAKDWCINNGGAGITYQHGRYEVRKYSTPRLSFNDHASSWIMFS